MQFVDLQDYVVYIGLLLITVLFGKIAEEENKLVWAIPIIIAYSAIAGLRSVNVGVDTITYSRLLEYIEMGNEDISKIDEGFKLFCKGLMMINKNPQFIWTVIAVITYSLIVVRMWDFRQFASFPFCLFAFYTSCYAHSLNIMRQYMAVAIVFWSSRFVFQKKYILYFISVILASFLHTSVLLGFSLMLYGFVTWKENSVLEKLFMFVSIIAMPVIVYMLFDPSRYTKYFDEVVMGGYLLYVALIAYFVFSLFYLNFSVKDLKRESTDSDLHIKMVIIIYYIASLLLNFVGTFFKYMSRVGLIFAMFGFVYHGMLTRDSKDTKAFLCLSTVYYIYLFTTIWIANSHGQIPYEFYWQ